MNILIIGSSNGLGKEIFEQKKDTNADIYTISKYSNSKVYDDHLKHTKQLIKTDLAKIQNQAEINLIVNKFPILDQIYFLIGGGFGRKDILPNYEDMLFIYKMNVFIISSLIKGLNEKEKMNKNSKICIVSSIASKEVTASPAYSSAKSALNTYGKLITKKKDTQFGSLTNFICGAFEGNGASFDRLKKNNLNAYNNYIKNKLPNGEPLRTKDLASYIITTMDFSKNILDGLTIKIDGNESIAI